MKKQNQGVFEGKMRWLEGDFAGRAEDEKSPELFGNFTSLAKLGANDRMLEESSDVFTVRRDVLDPVVVQQWAQEDDEAGFQIQRTEDEIEAATLHNVIVKMVVRRPAENVPWNDPRDLDPDAILAKVRAMQDASEGDRYATMSLEDLQNDDPEQINPMDALAHSEGLQDVADDDDTLGLELEEVAAALRVEAPKDRWDLVRDESSANEEDHYSADIYPHRADKCLHGYAANLSKAIDKGMTKKALFSALAIVNPVSAAKYQMEQVLRQAARKKSKQEMEALKAQWAEYLTKLAKIKEDRVPGTYVARLWEQIREREEQSEFLTDPQIYKRRMRNKIRSMKEQTKR